MKAEMAPSLQLAGSVLGKNISVQMGIFCK